MSLLLETARPGSVLTLRSYHQAQRAHPTPWRNNAESRVISLGPGVLPAGAGWNVTRSAFGNGYEYERGGAKCDGVALNLDSWVAS